MGSFTDFQTAIYKMLEAIPGENVDRPGLNNTPEKVAKLFLNEVVHGYTQNVNSIIAHATYESVNNDLVVMKDIPFYSMCEHHFVPFFGTVDIGYVPRDGKILDNSKFGRIVDVYSKRLQTQESMTKQIADALYGSILLPSSVAVRTTANNLCIAMRGSKKQNTTMVTQSFNGTIKDNLSLKHDWYSLVK